MKFPHNLIDKKYYGITEYLWEKHADILPKEEEGPAGLSGPLRYADVRKTGRLERFRMYGSNAQRIYLDCCSALGWKESLKGSFGSHKLLYAQKATKEGYSVWFVSYSDVNLDGGAFLEKSRQNYVLGDYVVEFDFGGVPDNFDKKDVRVTFLKIDNVDYAFLGVYEFLDFAVDMHEEKGKETDTLIRVFRKRSDTYPERG